MDIYVDESGDLSKYYAGSPGPRYFSLTFMITDNSSVTANIANHLIKKYGLRQELKHEQSSKKIKRKFAKKYMEAQEECFVRCYSVILDTKTIPEEHEIELDENPNYFWYKMMTGFVPIMLKNANARGPVSVFFDHRWNKSIRRKELNKQVKSAVRENLEENISLRCEHVDSRKEKNIQVADMFAGFSRLDADNKAHECYEEELKPDTMNFHLEIEKE